MNFNKLINYINIIIKYIYNTYQSKYSNAIYVNFLLKLSSEPNESRQSCGFRRTQTTFWAKSTGAGTCTPDYAKPKKMSTTFHFFYQKKGLKCDYLKN